MIRALLPLRGQAFTSIRSDQERAGGALHLQRGGPPTARPAGSFPRNTSTPGRPSNSASNSAPGRSSTSWSSDANEKTRAKPFGLCSYCDARGCANFNDPKADKSKCSVFGGCACKPGASADEVRFVDLCRSYLKTTGSKHQSPPHLKGTALRSRVWNHTMDVAQSTFASSSSSPRPRSPPSVVTNLSNSTSGVRVGRENRLRKAGQLRTMAAQFLETDDIEEAATLNKLADDLEQLDDLEDGAPDHIEPDVDKCLGAFNKLAVVNRFDNGDFDGAEGLLPEIGSLNSIQGTSKHSEHQEDDIVRFIDETRANFESGLISAAEWAERMTLACSMTKATSRVPSPYVQSSIEPVFLELPEDYAMACDDEDPQSVIAPVFVNHLVETFDLEQPMYDTPDAFSHFERVTRRFDLNDSDSSEDESSKRFDLNDSDSSYNGCGVVSYSNRCSFLLNAFRCILAHYNAFVRICTHFLRAAF